MPLKTLLCIFAGASLTLASCAEQSTSRSEQESTETLPTINSCDDGVEACEGNAICESCLIEGACSSGPSPVWTGTECVCAESDPANCAYEFCCALGFEWNPSACACLPCEE